MSTKRKLMELSINQILKSLMQKMHDFIKVLKYENESLDKQQISKITELQALKINLAGDIELYDEVMREGKFSRDDVAPKLRNEIKDVQNKLNSTLKENNSKLLKAREINKLVIDVIANLMAENERQNYGYNKEGKFISNKTVQRKTKPVNLNDQL